MPRPKPLKRGDVITVRNDFHNTQINLRLCYEWRSGFELTPSQVQRARRVLCGVKDCTCGGALGERGPQDVAICDSIDVPSGVVIFNKEPSDVSSD